MIANYLLIIITVVVMHHDVCLYMCTVHCTVMSTLPKKFDIGMATGFILLKMGI